MAKHSLFRFYEYFSKLFANHPSYFLSVNSTVCANCLCKGVYRPEKTFDTVGHKILRRKLDHNNVC